jgi:hypothetical protein|nr:MAG TPA: hypothetical protein [Caudoviricetes sp.]
MALTNLYINDIVGNATADNADSKIKALYGVKTVTVGGSSFIDGQSVIDALLATNVSSVQADNMRAGAVVSFGGVDWIVLDTPEHMSGDSGNCFLRLISKDIIGKSVFGETNNFALSSICKYLNAVRSSDPNDDWRLSYPGLNNIKISDLKNIWNQNNIKAQNGDTTYNDSDSWNPASLYVSFLCEKEFQTYYDTNSVLRYKGAETSAPYWLCTPVGCGNTNRVVVVNPDGTLSSAPCSSVCGVRPIIYLKIAKTATIQVAQLKLGG